MSVVISNGNTTVATPNGFYRVESSNLHFTGVGNVTTSTVANHLDVTFLNAGNCKGVGLGIGSISSAQNRGMRINLAENLGAFTVNIASPGVFTKNAHGLNDLDEVFLDTTGALPTGLTKKTVRYYVRNKTLNTFNLSTTTTGALINTSGTQSGTHSLWVARISQSYTVAEIMPANVNINDSAYAYMIVPFEFTNTYAVDTTVGKWRFIFWQEGGTTGSYYFMVSNGVISENFSHFAWCDNAVSFTNDDVLICKDKVTVDASFSIKGVLGTGNTVYSTAGIICRSLNKGVNDVANLVWENSPSASYKMTINGGLQLGSFSGIQVGSELNPIPASVKAVIEFVPASVGTDLSCIRYIFYSSTSRPCGKQSFVFYGEVPTNRTSNLLSTAVIGQNKITLTEDLSAIWNVGDEIVIGKQNVRGQGIVTTYTIASFNGAEITLNTNLLTNNRIAGATVINRSRQYGIEIKSNTDSTRYRIESVIPLHFRVSGVKFTNVYFTGGFYATTQYYEDASSTRFYGCDNLAWFTQTTAMQLFSVPVISRLGGDIKRNLCWRGNVLSNVGALYNAVLKSGKLTVESNIIISNYSINAGAMSSNNYIIEYLNNRWENTYYSAIALFGKNPLVSGNLFWGGSSTQPTIQFGTFCLNPVFINNTFDSNYYAIGYGTAGLVINGTSKNDIFGQEVANLYDFFIPVACLGDFAINSPTGNINTLLTSLPETINGFKLRISDENNTPNVDRMYLTEGYYVRCGDGLADTTVHTAGSGKFSLRMEPLNEPLQFTQYIPTGDISGKTMTVLAWVKLNSANYWSGTHAMPKLIVDYDDGTVVEAVALQTTDWQLLSLPFTPTTSTGKIKVTLQVESDVTGSDGYVYFDDIGVLYPAGVQLNLGGLDLWSGAEPITPTIATNVTAEDVANAVWAKKLIEITESGTTGKKLKDGFTVADSQALL